MRFDIIASTVLAFVSLVSAKVSVVSPSSRTVWKAGSSGNIQLSVSDSRNSIYVKVAIDLLCMGENSAHTLLNLQSSSSVFSNYNISIPSVDNSGCHGYFLKVTIFNRCGVDGVYFSPLFEITLDGKSAKSDLLDCDHDKSKEKTPEKTPKPTHSEEKPKETQSKEATKTTALPPPSSQPGPVPTKQPEKPDSEKPKPGDSDKPDESTTQEAPPKTSPTTAPTKKPNDVENSGSIVTYKFFGIILTIVTIFICS